MEIGRVFAGWVPQITQEIVRLSETGQRASLGSMVQNGKLEASAWPDSDRRLKREDFPTFGKPTMPIFKLALTRPKRGSGADPCPFFLVVLVEEVVREVILEGCVLL